MQILKIDVPEDKKNMIKLDDDMTLELKYPTYYSIMSDKDYDRHAETNIRNKCIKQLCYVLINYI